MNSGLKWLIEKSKIVKTYAGECVEKQFNGNIPYRMAMDIIKKNEWDSVSDANNRLWYASKDNMGLSYDTKTGIMSLSFCEAVS